MKHPLRAAALALGLALAGPLPALALVGGGGVLANSASSPWNGVGSLNVNGGLFTATQIAPGYLLTAAHVVAGAGADQITFQVNAGSSYTLAASAVFVNPDYTASTFGNLAGDTTIHNDLAIIKLATAPGAEVPTYTLFSGDLQGAELNLVSFGGNSSQKTTGVNVADELLGNAAGTNQTYLFDFDGPTAATNAMGGLTLGANREASLAGGDSGSAAFVNVNGQWQLAGINSFRVAFAGGPSAEGAFGTGGGGVVLSSYAGWIGSVVASPVPEPDGGALLLLGLPLLLGLTKRRESGRTPIQTH